MSSEFTQFLKKPVTGTVLAVASGVSFFYTCALMPLVGRAGSSVPYAETNRLAFLSAVGFTFLLAMLATWSKMTRRAEDKSPLPIGSLSLCAVCGLLVILLMSGLLAV